MKKFICIFLMLWLPLFTGEALAMGTQMQVANALHITEKAPHDACDDTQQHDVQHQPSHNHCNGNCFACGICAFGYQAVSFMSPSTVFVSDSASHSPNLPDLVFSSQLYPPALKPPISA